MTAQPPETGSVDGAEIGPQNSLAAWKVFIALVALGIASGVFLGAFGHMLHLFG